MDETLARWGRNIAAARERAGLTQEEFAEKVGVSWPTVWRWENGRHGQRRPHRARIAEVLGVEEAALFPIGEQVA